MSNPSKQRGTRWETAVVGYLREHGFPHAERRTLSGAADKGDINAAPGLVIECKNQSRHSWAEWLDEALAEARNVGPGTVGIVWAHRRGKADAGDRYVVMDGATATQLLRLAGYGDPIEEAS